MIATRKLERSWVENIPAPPVSTAPMRSALPAFLALVARLALGCGAAQTAEAPEEGLPLRVPPSVATASPPPVENEPEPTPPAPGEAKVPCPLQWTPRELHGSVFTLTAELHGRMVAPLIRAACACTRPGQSIMLAAQLVPELGEATAVTADRPEQHARASRSIDACLAKELGAGLYEPFHIGSDVVCDPPAKPLPPRVPGEPAHFHEPRRAGCVPEEEQRTTLYYPLHIDRCDER
jgi:hypothetical protein